MTAEPRPNRNGFTLIEMSIVLVIIGLIVGGILTGRDLIRAAEVRAQISQIEGYNTAVNTFRVKYNALPGDIGAADAATFGFTPRGPQPGEGDGNGVLEGWANADAHQYGFVEGEGESAMFWVDLTSANGLDVNLIAGSFSTASPTVEPGSNVTETRISLYLPAARIGRGNYVYVYSGDLLNGGSWESTGVNYFGLSAVNAIIGADGTITSGLTLSVQQAYSIDKKIDDGLPQSGNVTAQYLGANWAAYWAGSGPWSPCPFGIACNTANAGSSSTCFDNDGVGGTPQHYSLEINSGNSTNCALSFRFQ